MDNKHKYLLILDDLRSISDVRLLVKLPNDLTTILVKNYKEFKDFILENGISRLFTVSFDHDLSDVHYGHGLHGDEIPYDTYKEKTGYDCAQWLVWYCDDRGLTFPEYTVHSMNPVGRENIISYIESYKRFKTANPSPY